MMVDVCEHRLAYKEHQNIQENKDNISHSTARQRKYAVDELAEYFSEQDVYIDTEDFYKSTDHLKGFFDQTNCHNSKVACIRDFLKYIKKQLPTRDGDRVHDIRERIKYSRLSDDTGNGKSRIQKLEEKILSRRELGAVYHAADIREEVIVRMMLDMGTRPGELAALTPKDIEEGDYEGNIEATVRIDKTYSQGVGVKDSPKTEDSIRRVNIRGRTLDLLKKYIEQEDIGRNELMFGSYRAVYDSIKDVFTYACVKMDNDHYLTKFSPHSLRHNTATRLIRSGYPKEKVQKYLGHSSVKITEIYEHVNSNEVVGIYA